MTQNFELEAASLSKLAMDAKVTFITVGMNLLFFDDSDGLFAMESHGSVLAAVAHAFSRRIATVVIASIFNIPALKPWGSHPLLDPNYSSFDVSIRHDGFVFSRLEKVALISEWDAMLQNLRSYFNAFRLNDTLNCGKCEKCLRTMVALLVGGKLGQCRTYPAVDLPPDLLESIVLVPPRSRPVERAKIIQFACQSLGDASAHS